MFDTKIDMGAKLRGQICDILNQHLASGVDLQTQCKQAHWNVRGPSFYSLHLLFDKVNADVIGYVDLIAERIGQLGGYSYGTAQAAASDSELPEYPTDAVDGLDHVQALSNSLAAFSNHIRKSIKKVDDLGDDGTADILTEISRGVDSWLWMVESHLQGANVEGRSTSMKNKVKVVAGKR